MANVHRIGDYNNEGNNGGRYQEMNDNQNPYNMVLQHKIPFLYVPGNTKPALDESIPYTIKITFCPALTLFSFTNFLVLVLISLYITTCIMGIDWSVSILQIQYSVLVKMGGNVPINVYDGQVYRLLTAAFLHSNLPHILGNVFAIFFVLSRLQACFHYAYLIVIYLISAVSGNILSVLTSKNPIQVGVGASTAILGFIGVLIAYLIMNWSALGQLGPLRCQLTCMIGMLVFFSIFYSIIGMNSGVDGFGHLGGFIGGLFGALLILPQIKPNSPKVMKLIGGVVLFAYFLTTFLVFYLAKYDK